MPPQHEPTPEQRQIVQLHSTIGTPQDQIAAIIGIDPKTLRLHYRDELDLASAKANATIGGALFNKAKSGDTAAMIFWMKTRAGWRETNVLEMSGKDGKPIEATLNVRGLSDATLREIIEAAGEATEADEG